MSDAPAKKGRGRPAKVSIINIFFTPYSYTQKKNLILRTFPYKNAPIHTRALF